MATKQQTDAEAAAEAKRIADEEAAQQAADAAANEQGAKEAEPEEMTTGTGDYRVLTDGLVVRVGKKANEVRRVLRNAKVHLDAELVDIEHLIRLKAVAPFGHKNVKRTTALVATKAAGAPDDPAVKPKDDGTPVTEAPSA